jgi:hypothetical protein
LDLRRTSTKVIGIKTGTPQTQVSVGAQVGVGGGGGGPPPVFDGCPWPGEGVGLAFVAVDFVGVCFAGAFVLGLRTLVEVVPILRPLMLLTTITTEPEV